MTQTAHSSLVATSRLAGFDFDFNGTLDPGQLNEIATADFVSKGENLLLVGGPATGKTVIASVVLDSARDRGLTTRYIECPSGFSSQWGLLNHGSGFIDSLQSEPGFRPELLNCDVFVIDEMHRWLECAPEMMALLLGLRIELGKSNVLVFTSSGWASMLEKDRPIRSVDGMRSDFAYILELSMRSSRSQWQMALRLDWPMAAEKMLAILGIDFTLPTTVEADGEQQPSKPVSRHSYFTGKVPVWHSLYTGEKSYREVLRRRYA